MQQLGGRRWKPSIVIVLVCSFVMATIPGQVSAGDDDEPTHLIMAMVAMFLGMDELEDMLGINQDDPPSPYVPIGTGPVEGDPNPLCGAVAQSFRFDGSTSTSESFSLAALGDGVRTISPGDAGFFQFQQAFTVVLACYRTSPLLTEAIISEVSMAYRLFGQEVLETSQFPGEPYLGTSSVVSYASVKGTDLPEDQLVGGFSWVSGGVLTPSDPNPIPTAEFWRPEGYFMAWVVPGIPEEIRVGTGDAGAPTPDAVSVQQATITIAPEVVDLDDPALRTTVVAALPGVRQLLAESAPPEPSADAPVEDEPPADVPAEDVPAGDEQEPQTEPEPETAQPTEPGADPSDDPVDDDPPAAQDDADPASAGDQAAEDAARPESETDGNGGTGGSATTILTIAFLGLLVVLLLVWLFWWRPRSKSDRSPDAPAQDDTPAPEGRSGHGESPTGSTAGDDPPPDRPVVQEAEEAPPAVPGAPPPLVQCDWELWLGGQQLKPVAPGHLVCCVYRVEIETKRAPDTERVFFAGDSAGRVRIPGFRAERSALGLSAEAMTWTTPDDGTHTEQLPEAATVVADPSAIGALGDTPPDVAGGLSAGEATEVTVTLVSQCVDHQHQYTASAETGAELSALGSCSNTEPGDECAVSMGAASSGGGAVSGDLKLDVNASIALGGDRNEADDRHHDADDGRPAASFADRASAGPTVKADLVWHATFSSGFELNAAQTVPGPARPTTGEVESRALGSSQHALSLGATTTARACTGKACGCGATECTCEPSFSLAINVERQELIADNQTFTLSRGPGGVGRWTAS